MIERFEDKSRIVGVGRSTIGRRLGRTPLDLTLEAVDEALEDAGLTAGDLDGVCSSPSRIGGEAFAGPPVTDIVDALRLQPTWYTGIADGPSMFASIVDAMLAIAGGLAQHILVYRTLTEGTAQGRRGRAAYNQRHGAAAVVPGVERWFAPFHVYSAATWVAMHAQRYAHAYGLTREQLAALPLLCRRNAALDDRAVYRAALTLDEYLAAPFVSEPLCIFDCDVPCDGSTAVIISNTKAALSTRAPVRIEAVGSHLNGRTSADQWDDYTTMASRAAARAMWRRTNLTVDDVDVVQSYDGFSFVALVWLEALGFCAPGEAADFITADPRVGLNTAGGQLSGGRLHGFGLLREAVVQLRGEAGERQVSGAETAVVTGGATTLATSLLLTADR